MGIPFAAASCAVCNALSPLRDATAAAVASSVPLPSCARPQWHRTLPKRPLRPPPTRLVKVQQGPALAPTPRTNKNTLPEQWSCLAQWAKRDRPPSVLLTPTPLAVSRACPRVGRCGVRQPQWRATPEHARPPHERGPHRSAKPSTQPTTGSTEPDRLNRAWRHTPQETKNKMRESPNGNTKTARGHCGCSWRPAMANAFDNCSAPLRRDCARAPPAKPRRCQACPSPPHGRRHMRA